MNFGEEDASSGSGDDVHMLDGHKRQAGVPSSSICRKRSHKATGDSIVDAMLEIAAVSKMRTNAIMKNEDQFSISKCIKALDEMQVVDERIYFLASDLFENPIAREILSILRVKKDCCGCGASVVLPLFEMFGKLALFIKQILYFCRIKCSSKKLW